MHGSVGVHVWARSQRALRPPDTRGLASRDTEGGNNDEPRTQNPRRARDPSAPPRSGRLRQRRLRGGQRRQPGAKVTIVGQKFTEADIMTQLYKQLLDKEGFETERQEPRRPRHLPRPAGEGRRAGLGRLPLLDDRGAEPQGQRRRRRPGGQPRRRGDPGRAEDARGRSTASPRWSRPRPRTPTPTPSPRTTPRRTTSRRSATSASSASRSRSPPTPTAPSVPTAARA